VPFLFLIFASARTAPAGTDPPPADVEFFEKNVRPLLVERCWPCHGKAEKLKGGLELTSRPKILKGGDSGPAAVTGDPAASLLVQAIGYEQEPKMPPKGKLKDREIQILSRWVAMGLPWPETMAAAPAAAAASSGTRAVISQRRFWSFQPVKAIAVPNVCDTARARIAVDRFLLADLEKNGLSSAAPSNRRTLIRRATFDLIGLPPTPEEIDAFLADHSPQAFARVIDRLLASPRYGERWGRHWLDVVRYADARDLIQLPAESDFRDAWRYRDWVVSAFNHDLPYTEFAKNQVAGDLLPEPNPGAINKDGLVATGMLAIADFVPGDVDKDQMIADYVNDQIDVISKSFLGISVACARCHDHKFDPISTGDYYALAGIFFSTRLIPGPVSGNTPLVRVPLLSADELKKVHAEDAADRKRRAELEQSVPDAVDRAYVAYLRHVVLEKSPAYLLAATEYRRSNSGAGSYPLERVASQRGLHQGLLAGFIDYLNRVAAQHSIARHATLRDAAAGTLAGARLEKSASALAKDLATLDALKEKERAHASKENSSAKSCLIRLRADDPHLLTDGEGRVLIWPNRAGLPADARPIGSSRGPVKTSTAWGGHTRTVLRFDGEALLAFPRRVPSTGSLFVIFRTSDKAMPGQRLLGWEDSDAGKHGLGLLAEPGGRLHAVLRDEGKSGDLVGTHPTTGFDLVCLTWGPRGATLHRNGQAAGSQTGIDALSSDPAVAALRLGGPGSGGSPRFQGELAEIRVYDRQLDERERLVVEAELRMCWLERVVSNECPIDPLNELYEELLSARGPFWLSADERKAMLPPEDRSRLESLTRELDALKQRKPRDIPQAVVVQDGGPKGTRHEGFKDAQVFVRGNSKRLGKTVPRGIPQVLVGEHGSQVLITAGSGRRELADWLARPDNPLVARVMINRLWQHHFGEGLVRTPNDFGERGERPTNLALLDWLAARFVQSGWSVKAMHRLIMFSSAYQQSSDAGAHALARDPENRLFGRMNRRRLDAEAIRDSLLSVAGRLGATMGGTPFADLASPRRTLYLQSVRTGAGSTDFGHVFDRADPGSIVGVRGESVVAPQALFFLNDPFVNEMARALAARIESDEPVLTEARVQKLYAVTLGRPPSRFELDLAIQALAHTAGSNAWERYCQLMVCQNEFLYTD
jgi:Protein of unknown function (DUF1553)/Protein of unknown function (DUF1549)/Planctomycete cytochrome C/Concanavalin A-like lectin/glucanases superfamily